MLGRNLGLAISCALGASSFLLPPGVTSDKDAVVPFVAIDPKHQYFELPCSDCDTLPFADPRDGPNNLLLNFTISEDGQALLLNEEQLYPLDYAIENILDLDWTVYQLPVSFTPKQFESGEAPYVPLHITGHVYSTSPVDMLTPDGDGVITIRWQLLALEHEMVTIDEVLVQLLRTGDGELLILSVDTVPSPEEVYTIKPIFPGDAPPRPQKDCKYSWGPLCEISKFMDSSFGGAKKMKPGCTGKSKFDPFEGRLPTHIRPHFGPSGEFEGMPDRPEGASGPHGRPHMHGPHRHHHNGFHSIARSIEAILTPVLLGLGIGLIVFPLGLLTGRFIGWLCFTAFRGGKRGYARVALDDSTANLDKNRESFESVDPLPQYENAPAYEETEKEAL